MQSETTFDQPDHGDQAANPATFRLAKGIRDGYEVHRAALERGLNIRLLPRQVMQVMIPEDSDTVAGFAHGIPQQTSLAGATYAQDLRMRRAMLLKAGFSVPRGATFSVGRSRVLGRKFAERIGFPVVIKPAVGDNTIEVQTDITNKLQFKQAVEYLFTPPNNRKDFTRSAYALTELREPGKVNGKLVAPPGYRFLVEKQERGDYLRFLVIDGVVCNVLFCPDGPWKTRRVLVDDVTDTVHPSLIELATDAAKVVPGLNVVALDMVVPDYGVATSAEDAKIVEFSERPWLSVQLKTSPQLASRMADLILEAALPETAGYQLRELVDTEVLIGGAVDPVALLDVLADQFSELGIDGRLYESDHTLGQIRGQVKGDPKKIAWVYERLLDKGIKKQRAMLVEQKSL
ncbi:hypothetical protein [Brevibacterium aurantiacum]|uniref:ATP-grasp domain-containing protein n=1 Tax=Brevibacterium aurantiacum TaxID=273384 RepID=A0A2H1J283_BREAU|nr:hypothetical protein [Brevibacterium aurantiacum]SMX81550.1 hypothetical protein BAUR920_01654 [Brevibacterium aurantiacum]